MTQIAFLLYDEMTALDAVGPYEVLARLPDAEVSFVASTPGPIRTDVGLRLVADAALDDVPEPDLVVVPSDFGAEPVAERVVVDGKVITAAGVSSGIDMALTLAALEADEDTARMLQLVVEYDPQPPFDSGSYETADEGTRDRATRYFVPAAPA